MSFLLDRKLLFLVCLFLNGACGEPKSSTKQVPSTLTSALRTEHETCVTKIVNGNHLRKIDESIGERLPSLIQQITDAPPSASGLYELEVTNSVSIQVSASSFTIATEEITYSLIFLGGAPSADNVDTTPEFHATFEGSFEWQRTWHTFVFFERGVNHENLYLCNTPDSTFEVTTDFMDSDTMLPTVTFDSGVASLQMTYATLPIEDKNSETKRAAKFCRDSTCTTTTVTNEQAQRLEAESFGDARMDHRLNLHEPIVSDKPWIRYFANDSILELIFTAQCKGPC